MDITIYPKKLHGTVSAIPSKSQAHRLLICAAFADNSTVIHCAETNQDIEATAGCLRALGADITYEDSKYTVVPAKNIPKCAELNCGESGSTLRFMLPIVGALGVDANFKLGGRLPYRPLSPLWEVMESGGCTLCRPTENTIRCTGKLSPGEYKIAGNISSQYITGLLFAIALLPGTSSLVIEGKLESRPYVDMTLHALQLFGIHMHNMQTNGNCTFRSPGEITVEGDWSNGAFFLAARYLGSAVQVSDLHDDSLQGDRAVRDLLPRFAQFAEIDAADIPDLIPILAVVAGASKGAVFTNVSRLRLKESDRVMSVCDMLNNFGIRAESSDNTITVYPGTYCGCVIDSVSDHRIAMSAAIASTVATGSVTIIGAECVAKSYPAFWDVFRKLGGHYEQYIR